MECVVLMELVNSMRLSCEHDDLEDHVLKG